MNWLFKHFLRGLIIVVPVAVTLWVIVRAFNSIDQLVGFKVPGIGVVVIVGGTILIGILASNFVGRRFVALTSALFERAPLVGLIYASIKDLLEAFVGDKKRFDRPVAVAINDGVMTFGFMTQDDLSFLGLPGRVAVYMPFAYSMAGSVVIVEASRVKPLPADSSTVMALIVSGGVSRAAA
jgi:uncharacterized membrane protein